LEKQPMRCALRFADRKLGRASKVTTTITAMTMSSSFKVNARLRLVRGKVFMG
jgi:hypothetical protein